MLGVSYFLLCVAAKLFTGWMHGLEWSGATPFVLFWQDAIVGLLLGGIGLLAKRPARLFYWILALHLAACMPLLQLMATPLTRPLLNAAGGTLSDSFSHCLNSNILAPTMLVVLFAAALPRALPPFRSRIPIFAAAMFVVVSGWWLTPETEVYGLQRNAAAALIGSYLHGPVLPSFVLASEIHDNCSSAPRAGSAAGLNLLVVTVESTGSRFLQPYGATIDPMPRLSALALQGWVLENAYAAYPESVKGLLSVLASRLPRSGLKESDFSKLASPSLASALAESGYETALFHSGRFMYLGMNALVRGSGFSVADDAAAVGGDRESSFGVDDKQTVDHVLRWFDQRSAANPFYIHYLPISGHHPYDAPAGPWLQSDDRSRYLNALHYSDQLLGELIDGLRMRGLLEKTLIVVYGDHGEGFGEHPGNYGHTLFLYEENVRVPLILWAPAIISAGRCERITSLVDLAPTLCDLLGVKAPETFEGLSLLQPQTRPALFITDYSLHLAGIRDGPWKYIYERESGYARLFDLRDDPNERTNVRDWHRERAVHYAAQLLEWNGKEGEPSFGTDP